jgi:hypothetical protein
MSAALRFYDSDGTTVITSYDFGTVASPGSTSSKKFYIENFGDQTAQTTTIDLEAVGTNDGDDYAQTALDVAGSPGAFGTSQLTLGSIAAGIKVAFWSRVVLPSGVTADNNTRRYNLTGTAFTI